MTIEEAQQWALNELEHLERRLRYETDDPITPLTKQGLKDLTDAHSAITLLLQIAALHTGRIAGLETTAPDRKEDK